MKQRLLILLAVMLFIGGYYLYTKYATKTNVTSPSACDTSLWNHVYHPQRLQIVDQCKTVSGIIESAKAEKDGDYHIRLRLDQQYANLVNARNDQEQHGDLVLEPICENPVRQEDAIASCQGFRGNVTVPPIGTHVQVTGSYVLDADHGWMEIHPVTTMVAQ